MSQCEDVEEGIVDCCIGSGGFMVDHRAISGIGDFIIVHLPQGGVHVPDDQVHRFLPTLQSGRSYPSSSHQQAEEIEKIDSSYKLPEGSSEGARGEVEETDHHTSHKNHQ